MKMLPIKWRISLLVAAVLIAVIATVSAVAYHEMEESLYRNIDQTLLAMANGIHAAIDDAVDQKELDEEVTSILGNSARRQTSSYRIWWEESLRDISVSDSPDSAQGKRLREMTAGDPPPLGQPTFWNLLDDGRRRAVWARYTTSQGTANILILRSGEYAHHEMMEFLRFLLILGPTVVAGSVAAVIFSVWWGLRPVGRTAEKLRTITYRNLGITTLADIRSPSELRPFVDAVSQLLIRLDEAMRRQEQFTSDAAHELRTPLALAKSTLQAASIRDRDASEYKQALSDAVSDLDRMDRLVSQMLLLARMDAGDGPEGAAELDLAGLLAELGRKFDEQASQSGGRVKCADLPGAPVFANEQQLAQLFGNLLDNAIRHGPPGGTIEVSLRHNSSQSCTVRIHDEGGSIPADALPRLFDRFYRTDSSRSRSCGGAGLGLAIARKIARLHDGDIEIKSAPSTGTEVLVHLPLARF